MKNELISQMVSAMAIWLVAAAGVHAAMPPAPGSFANCDVLSYSTSGPAAGKKAGLLSASAAGSAGTVETWVVRSKANRSQTYAVRRTLLGSGEISMCAYTPNRVLATLVAGKSYAAFEQEMAAKGLAVVRELMRDLDGNAVYVIEAAETENDIVEQMTMSIESTGSCSLVRPDHIYEANAVPNDTYYSSQWALEKIGAPQAWDTRTDASSVLVAVLDTGVNHNHYDLNRSMWVNDGEILGDGVDNDGNGIVDDIYGMSCIGGNVSGDSMDDNGHGSHCAGIIGAAGNNRQWISGVAWRAKVMGLKFLNSEGKGSVSDAITCLCYAEMMGVKVVNCSFGSTDWDDYLYIQMKKMSQNGTIFVCAAGNAEPGMSPRDNDEYPFYPCNYSVDTLVSVAATDQNDALANFSYYGAQNVDIAAPGVNINSTVLGTYGLDYKDGTSMATPHVAGALALLIAHYPGDTPLQIIDRLYAAAEPVPALVGKVRTGARLSMAGFFGIPAPEEISVTQGSIADAVVVYWTAVNGGTHYRVWRAASKGGEKTMLCDWQQGLTFSDETAEPGVTYWYYLQAASSINGASASTYSIGVSGFRPEIDMSRITVSFDPVGGTVSPASRVYRVGETYNQMPVPTYSGKEFLGWFTEADGGVRLDEPSLVRADATTLHAHWIGSDVLRVMNLFARQRYPWNGYVDVTFDLAGVPEDETASVSLTAQEESGGSPLELRTFVGPAPTNLVNGAQHVVWNATPDTQGILYTNMILAATVALDEKPLLPPENVTASNATDADAVVVTWSASENATSYEVWRASANSSASATRIATPTATSYRDTSAVPAVTYWYWVKAVNSKKTSEFSASASGSRKKIVAGIAISGSSSVTAGDTATYTCTATYNDNTTATVSPSWSITSGSSYASINSSGTLTANGTATQRSVTIQASYSYNGSTQTATKDVTINTKSVTITFNANGGSVSPTSQSYTAYGKYDSLPAPTLANYSFLGWFTDSTGGTPVTTSSDVPASATTLYAHWQPNTYTVTLDRQSGSGGSSSVTATFGSAMPSITPPTRTGYTFGGYYTGTGGNGTQYYTASGDSAHTCDMTANTTLYAKWTANTYTIRFNANGGAGMMSDLSMTYDIARSLPSNNFSRVDYTFAGWAANSGGDVVYPDGVTVNNLAAVQDAVVNLYAVWNMVNVVPTLKVDSAISTAGAMLSWTEIPSAQYYMVYKNSSDNISGATLLSVTPATNYVDSYSGSVAGTTYYYWVRSITGSGAITNGYSTVASGYGLLADPKNVTASKGSYSSYVRVTWSAVSGATSYRVYRNTIPVWNSATQIGTTASTSYSDTTASTGVQYYYWVHGVCSTCTSPMGAYDTGYVGTLAETEEPVHAAKGALYKVIDLSGGTGATSYPVYYLNAMPENGWTEEFKTKKLVMRRVEAGTFMMGSPESELGRYADETQHQVTLTEPFYVGVFPVTAEQWRLVSTNMPSSLSSIASMPANYIYYSRIRGSVEGEKWPESNSVDDSSFLGALRKKADGAEYDLPTEAQWEYACRAGTQTAFNRGEISNIMVDPLLDTMGRYAHNGGAIAHPGGYLQSGFKVNVGQYMPNNWGLYDMHGNVREWCRDWYKASLGSAAVTNPVGGVSSTYSYTPGRVQRGGEAAYGAQDCRSAYRRGMGNHGGDVGCGFRLVCPVEMETFGEALESLDLSFTTGGNADWKVVTDESYYGGSSAKSGEITHSQSTWLQTEVYGCGTLTFWYKVSSESNWDKLMFYVDGDLKTAESGTGSGWNQLEFSITNNAQHVLKWVYSKDSSVSSGSDCVWIDRVTWVNSSTVILDQQGGNGGTASIAVTYGSAMPAITPPIRDGYTFGGYYTGMGGTGTRYYTELGESARAWDRTGSATLYAYWKAPDLGYFLPYGYGWSAEAFLSDDTNAVEKTTFYAGTSIYIYCCYGNVGSVALTSDYTIVHKVLDSSGTMVTAFAADCFGEEYWLEPGYGMLWDGMKYTALQNLPAGTYTYQCILDSKDAVIELSETNNVINVEFVVLAKNSTVTLDMQSGSGGTSSVTASYGENMPAVTVPVRTGYTFGGYYTGTGGSGTQYYTSSGASARTWDKTSDTTLYAKWTANSYILSVNPNGGTLVGSNFGTAEGTGQQASVNVTYDALYYYELGTATRSGYTFDGWWTSATGGEKVYNANGLAVTGSRYWNTSWQWQYLGNLTIYAHWVSVGNTVTLNMQSGSGGTSSVTATYGSSMPSITVPTRTGYTFGGYYTGTGGSGTQYYTSSGASARIWDKTSDTTLYAKWTANTYTVTLNMQSGSGGTSSVTATYGSSMPSITVPTRSGYTFGGYYTGTNGSGTQYYTASGASARTWDKTSATTLYAKWTIQTYTITLNKQNGSGGSTTVYATYGSAMPSITIPTRTGYSFGGYYTSTGGSGTQYYTASGASARTWDKKVATTLYAKWIEAQYIVIDLSNGSSASSYPVSYLDSVPSGGWNDTYKTSKLVLRLIPAGTFTMGSPTGELGRYSNETQHQVTLGKSFYIGVFEITQRQWELVMGTKPSMYNNSSYYSTRPVEHVTYEMIRGSSSGSQWPSSSAVDSTSFIGKIRSRSGLTTLDLPTEAEWEYSCRAGTTTALNSGKDLTSEYNCSNMSALGRYWYNSAQQNGQSVTTASGTNKVGSYTPNSWGLYDMHGNVGEWCLDWQSSYETTSVTDPKGASSGSYRRIRGGNCGCSAMDCRSANRSSAEPASLNGAIHIGLRAAIR